MNLETQLKLQAFVDGELSPRETREITQLLATDAAAQALVAELRSTATLLKGNELEVTLPESGDFFWSKIEREIRREPSRTTRPEAANSWWIRWAAPLAGATVLLALAISLSQRADPDPRTASAPESKVEPHKIAKVAKARFAHEFEVPSDETTVMTFHSESAGMTVVWLASDRN